MTDTIVAQATPPGKGGVGIIRVSGPLANHVAEKVLNKANLKPRQAMYLPFFNGDNHILDQGIALLFKAPHSFTGEDVLELQGHGGPVVMDMLMDAILDSGNIRMARPGEFSEQAFLNDKLDLAQAEAIADLIDASSVSAARSALRSLQGDFSNQVSALSDQVVALRMYVEAAIDFPDEEIDFLSDGKVASDLSVIKESLAKLSTAAHQGSLLREGMHVVIAGKPNAGKSSLLNALSGKETAIVTDIAGTTRDVLKEYIHINGVPLHIIDTAGLRDSSDKVEQIGIARAWEAIEHADLVLFVVDATEHDSIDPHDIWPEFMQRLPKAIPVMLVRNKIDKTALSSGVTQTDTAHGPYTIVSMSAETRVGLTDLQSQLADFLGLTQINEGQFTARRRHLDALKQATQHVDEGEHHLLEATAGELLAEELRLAHQALCEITGEFTSDDLLGKIFSSFCIGK